MKSQLITMLEMQDAMNTRVNAHWQQQNFEWYRAIWIECAELMDHFGWKWWKKQSPDTAQVVLELVDIWHFGLSIVLTRTDNFEAAADLIAKDFKTVIDTHDFRQSVEAFAVRTLDSKGFDVRGFSVLMSCVDLSFDELYRRYIGKNVLNFLNRGYDNNSKFVCFSYLGVCYWLYYRYCKTVCLNFILQNSNARFSFMTITR